MQHEGALQTFSVTVRWTINAP